MKKDHLDTLLAEWRESTVPAASALVAEMFKSADRVMLEYADKAETNAIQTRFFEGQREIWLKQEQVTAQFHDKLYHDILQFNRNAEKASEPEALALSLVSKDTFERSLALQLISEQAVKRNMELYHALSQRLGVITGRRAVAKEDIPAGPHQLATVFEQAAQLMNVEREILLALFTLFERDVIRHSIPWQEDLNEKLRVAGILPNLKYKVRVVGSQGKAKPADDEEQEAAEGPSDQGGSPTKAPAPGQAPTSPSAGNRARATDEEVEIGDQVLSRVRELLATQRARQAAERNIPVRPDPVNPAPAETVATAIEATDATANEPLNEVGALEPGKKQIPVSKSLLQRVRSALTLQRAQIKETVGRNKLSHVDEDVIDIVGMLFEVMLNDKRLGNTVKALLSHLHTPYLKIAIRDRTFLNHREYPARRLFDDMIEAGSRWVDERELGLGLYPQLQETVERIVRAKDHPVQLFQELEEKLRISVRQLSERQKVREARTVETEKGKARLEEARQIAATAIRGMLNMESAPTRYLSFVTGPWTDYLTLLYLRSKGDVDTGGWRGSQVLGHRLHALMENHIAGRSTVQAEITTLQDEFSRRLGQMIPQYQSEVGRLFSIFAGDYEPGEVTAKPAAVKHAAPAQTDSQADSILLSPNGEALLGKLPNLPQGTWIVFHEEGESDRVVKMSWFNAKTERFLFVDQNGAKAMGMPLREFADSIDREHAHVLHASGTSYVESSLRRAMEALEKRA